MNIGQARRLQVGQVVSFPADRGTPAGRARITHISEGSAVNIYGACYVWVSLQELDHHRSAGVWPSNRLGY